jgi:hypothetical protein
MNTIENESEFLPAELPALKRKHLFYKNTTSSNPHFLVKT